MEALLQLTSTPPSVYWFQQHAELILKPTSDFSITATFTTSFKLSNRVCRAFAHSCASSVAHFCELSYEYTLSPSLAFTRSIATSFTSSFFSMKSLIYL